jgi:REP element-mobilizing transposase RayT
MAKFDPKIHDRRSIRLKGYDYAQAGAYFVTVVTWHRECLFGEIQNGEMRLNKRGEIVQKWWGEISIHFNNVETGAFAVMPNHVHGIISIVERRGTVPVPETMGTTKSGGETQGGMTPPLRQSTLGQIVAYFKYQSTKEMNAISKTGVVTTFWQRNYHEHIIRDETDLKNKTDYINANPPLWEQDEENKKKAPG